MVFRQFVHDDLGCASYLVGDEDAGVAAVVDPRLDVEEYLRVARYLGVVIAHVLETHTHADHVSGHGRLHEATGAAIHIHRDAAPDYPHQPIDDGWTLALGAVRVRAIHTPGHRPEHTAFALVDTTRGPEPWAVLTGDSLFVGDVARPDLAIDAEEGARQIHRSLRGSLLSLPPETEVWPGHLGGSTCGGPGMSMKICSTIGFERAHNPLLAEDEDGFVRAALAALGPQPPNFREVVAMNRGPLRSFPDGATALAAARVEELRDGGALLVDVRTDVQFDEAHVPGAVSIPAVRSGFGTRLGWLVRPGQEVVLIGRDDEDGLRAARYASAVGVHTVAGYLAGGMTAWHQAGGPLDRVERVRAADLPALLAADPDVQVLDVRERHEWEAGHVPGAVHAPYRTVTEVPDGIDPGRPVAVMCASGQRSGVAVGMLRNAGVERVVHVAEGGLGAWERGGNPVARGGSG
jgi:hydroxyacylglutathione hydrolase